MHDLHTFFASLHFLETTSQQFEEHQLGYSVSFGNEHSFDWADADLVIIGCGEAGNDAYETAPDAVRAELYKMYNWHPSLHIFDAGNIMQGATSDDTRAALRAVLAEVQEAGKAALVIGGSHDLMLQQYEVFKRKETLVNAAVVDMLIDLEESEATDSHSFLMDMLTSTPNFIRHYAHMGFQSYYVQPRMLETLDKLRFDFFRLGRLRENMEEAEPVIRDADIFSFDLSAVRYPDAIANIKGSPNGFTGEEACMLARFAGMSSRLASFGLYGYDVRSDRHGMTAKLMAQMVWYFLDGLLIKKNEPPLSNREGFTEFHLRFAEVEGTFLKSKRTARWWMEMPDGTFLPCSYNDYLIATQNEMPERWLREQERLV